MSEKIRWRYFFKIEKNEFYKDLLSILFRTVPDFIVENQKNKVRDWLISRASQQFILDTDLHGFKQIIEEGVTLWKKV
jgi:hypothetical protein